MSSRRQQRRPRSGNRGRRTEQQEHGRSTNKGTRIEVETSVSLHVGTRLANGTMTHLTVNPYKPSQRVSRVLSEALEDALAMPPRVCSHALLSDDLVLTVKSRRLLCPACAQQDNSWKKGASCDLCGSGEAVFAAVDIATRVVGLPGAGTEGTTRHLASFCPACVRVETGLEVTP